MKITDRLIGDHKTFRKLITDINDTAEKPLDTQNKKRLVRLVELFKSHMVLHAWGEDTFYYPAIRSHIENNNSEFNSAYMDKLDEEHLSIDGKLADLEKQVKEEPASPDWRGTYRSFVEGLTNHMDEEEQRLFPFSEQLLGIVGLEKISDELERRRSEAPAIKRHSSF